MEYKAVICNKSRLKRDERSIIKFNGSTSSFRIVYL